MSHHGREYEDDRDRCDADCAMRATRLSLAVEFIKAVANTPDTDWATRAAEFLDRNGFDGPLREKRRREKRAADLDAEIARLRAEREKL